MTRGDGQNISKVASSSTDAAKISTSLPYISYVDLADWLDIIYQHSLTAIDAYLSSIDRYTATPIGFKNYCDKSDFFSDVFICDGYRLCRAAKLLMALGYGNFTNVVQYDIYAQVSKFLEASQQIWNKENFLKSGLGLNLTSFESSSIVNSPNLSILPLLAYHKICNDHYRNEKWQSFEPWT